MMNLWTDDNASMMDAFISSSSTDISPFNWPPSSSASTTNNTLTDPKLINQSQPSIFFSQETLQHRLQTLIEGARENWTYAIFWQSSVETTTGASLLGWGDGYYKGEEDKLKKKTPTPTSAAEQDHRKKVLRDLNSMISGVPASSDDAVDEEVTDTEWYFLISMMQSFVNGSGLPGQAFFTTNSIWIAGNDRLASSSCERAKQAQVFGLQTMVCIPLSTGVVELGSTDLIFQSSDLMNKVRVLFNFNNPESGSWPPPSNPVNGDQGENDPSLLWITDPSSVIEIKESVNTPVPSSVTPARAAGVKDIPVSKSYQFDHPSSSTVTENPSSIVQVSHQSQQRPVNYIETSTLWRQEHNGFSHQAPGFINSMLTLPRGICRVYLPPDANTFTSCLAHCLRSKNYVNLLVGAKHPTPVYLTPEEADKHCIAGGGVWERYSTDGGKDPDVVLVGIGVEMTNEVIHAAALLSKEAPSLRVRVVNIVDLLILEQPGSHPHALSVDMFHSLFTSDKPVVINFHGYPAAVRSLIFSRSQGISRSRFTILGYIEEGTTTTPFSMLRLNHTSRFDVAYEAIVAHCAAGPNTTKIVNAHQLAASLQHRCKEHEKYTLEHGEDPPELSSVPLFEQ